MPGDRADRGIRPVWFPGSSLAYDLSLARIRECFDLPSGPVDWTSAEARIREAAVLLGAAGRPQGGGDAAALGDLLVVAAACSPVLVRDRLQQAAAFEQASRAPGARSLEGRARAGWRASARALQQAPRTARGGGGAPVVLHLLIVLIEAVEASRRWHEAAEHRAQARAAADAAVLLREAATAATAAGAPARPAPRATATTTSRTTTRTTTRGTSKTAGRGPAPSPPVTRVPPRTGPDRPGASRTH